MGFFKGLPCEKNLENSSLILLESPISPVLHSEEQRKMHRDIFHQLYYHITWSTAERNAFLEDAPRRAYLIRIVQEAAQRHGGHVLACNAMPDHVHLLVSLPPGDVAQYIGRVKGASSFGFNKEFAPAYKLVWQDGYGVVSLRKSDINAVTNYIENQETIHANRQTFPDLECRSAVP